MPTSTILSHVLLQHLEELARSWEQRAEAVSDGSWTPADLRKLDERLVAHVDGLLLAGDKALPLLADQFASPDPWIVTAAAYIMLAWGSDAADQLVCATLQQSEDERLQAIGRALNVGRVDRIHGQLVDLSQQAPIPLCVVVSEALARHRLLERSNVRWREGLAHEQPCVRETAWRIVALVDR